LSKINYLTPSERPAWIFPRSKIDFGGGNTITLNSVNAASLLTSDFVFGTP
jgi:hypothetical protein